MLNSPTTSSIDQLFESWESLDNPIEKNVKNSSSLLKCEKCLQDGIIEEGYLICNNCSEILSNKLDTGAEWRFYGSNETESRQDPCRVGLPSSYLVDNSLGSIIIPTCNESFKMRRIRQYHGWNLLNYKGRNLFNIYDQLHTNSKRNGIPNNVIEKAKFIFKIVSEKQLFRGDNKNGLIAVCCYRACKDLGVPRSTKEISEYFNIDETTITKGNRCLSKVLKNITINDSENEHYSVVTNNKSENPLSSISKPVDYVARFSCKLNIDPTYQTIITNLAVLIDEKRIVPNNTASSIAAAVMYFVIDYYNLSLTKMDIAKASKISEVTIGKCYKNLKVFEKYINSVLEQYQTKSSKLA